MTSPYTRRMQTMLDSARDWRRRPDPGVMRDRIAADGREVRNQNRSHSRIVDVLQTAVPWASEIVGFEIRRGVLTLGVSSSARCFELTRELRRGLEQGLIRASVTPIRKVKVEVRI